MKTSDEFMKEFSRLDEYHGSASLAVMLFPGLDGEIRRVTGELSQVSRRNAELQQLIELINKTTRALLEGEQ